MVPLEAVRPGPEDQSASKNFNRSVIARGVAAGSAAGAGCERQSARSTQPDSRGHDSPRPKMSIKKSAGPLNVGVANLSGAPKLSGKLGQRRPGVIAVGPTQQEKPVSSEPTLSAAALLEQLRGRFEQLCQDVAAAVNQAPAGQVINASEEK